MSTVDNTTRELLERAYSAFNARDIDCPSGRVIVEVHQVVRNVKGQLLMDRIVQHVYLIEVGRIRTMEIRDGGRLGASDPASG